MRCQRDLSHTSIEHHAAPALVNAVQQARRRGRLRKGTPWHRKFLLVAEKL